ncbi:MAG: type II toxin-antitoxin system VapC family toxin [Micrococcales bacterium]|nr:type II toxin-antitoxin system VapC family toxin [Micrococcales bacterium]
MAALSRVLADTSILVAIVKPSEPAPDLAVYGTVAVSALTWSELAVGLHSSTDLAQMRRRLEEYTALRSLFTATVAYDDACASAYLKIVSRVAERGGTVKARPLDRMIAATALAHDLPLVTRNGADFAQLDGLVDVHER